MDAKIKITADVKSWLSVSKNKIYPVIDWNFSWAGNRQGYSQFAQVKNDLGKVVSIPWYAFKLIEQIKEEERRKRSWK